MPGWPSPQVHPHRPSPIPNANRPPCRYAKAQRSAIFLKGRGLHLGCCLRNLQEPIATSQIYVFRKENKQRPPSRITTPFCTVARSSPPCKGATSMKKIFRVVAIAVFL